MTTYFLVIKSFLTWSENTSLYFHLDRVLETMELKPSLDFLHKELFGAFCVRAIASLRGHEAQVEPLACVFSRESFGGNYSSQNLSSRRAPRGMGNPKHRLCPSLLRETKKTFAKSLFNLESNSSLG